MGDKKVETTKTIITRLIGYWILWNILTGFIYNFFYQFLSKLFTSNSHLSSLFLQYLLFINERFDYIFNYYMYFKWILSFFNNSKELTSNINSNTSINYRTNLIDARIAEEAKHKKN